MEVSLRALEDRVGKLQSVSELWQEHMTQVDFLETKKTEQVPLPRGMRLRGEREFGRAAATAVTPRVRAFGGQLLAGTNPIGGPSPDRSSWQG